MLLRIFFAMFTNRLVVTKVKASVTAIPNKTLVTIHVVQSLFYYEIKHLNTFQFCTRNTAPWLWRTRQLDIT